ncbi:MAG: hypothetical protein ACLRFI_00600 [Alphaproteobacteria bacterium]
MSSFKTKINNAFDSPKFANATNLVIMVILVFILCKGCDVVKNNEKDAEEIAGLKKEIVDLKDNDANLNSKLDVLGNNVGDLHEIVDSCCCDCNKKKQNDAKPVSQKTVVKRQQTTVVNNRPVVKPQQSNPIIIRDTVVRVVHDTVVAEPQPVVAEPVDTVAKRAKGYEFTLYIVDSKSKRR